MKQGAEMKDKESGSRDYEVGSKEYEEGRMKQGA